MTLRDSLNYQPTELGFGTSGLRGLISDMTDLECYVNVRGFLSYIASLEQLHDGDEVYIAGDLRSSTPRIITAVARAVADAGAVPVMCGLIPTPAVAYHADRAKRAAIMVTGSHIPDDRNGIKFYKTDGEVLKADEAGIFEHVAAVRAATYAADSHESPFNEAGALTNDHMEVTTDVTAAENYLLRFKDVFASGAERPLHGKTIVVYQHSAVGRDMLSQLCEDLGATTINVGRTDVFTPIDTENVTPQLQEFFTTTAADNPGLFAIVSTDGDSDRPFLVDERGVFHRGDDLGAFVAGELQADFAAFPISSSDAVDRYAEQIGMPIEHTKIGSPYVITAMQAAESAGKTRTVGWEANGGFLLGSDIDYRGGRMTALPTRDAFFPILVTLCAAADKGQTVSELFAELPQRATAAGLIDNFPGSVSKTMMNRYSDDSVETRTELSRYFTKDKGFGMIERINSLDGVRLFFDNGEIAHLRPSGNAPQLRCYAVADSQQRADEIVALAIAEPDGIFRMIERSL